jgi:uncharacterized protein DUF4440
MKSIFAITLVAITLSVFSLGCNMSEQANSNVAPTNSNSTQPNAQAPANTAPPNAGVTSSTRTDKAQLLKDLVAVEREYLEANREGDKATLERLLADDFTTRSQNQLYDKVTWIGDAPGYPNIAGNDISNPELVGYTEDTATVHLTVRRTFKDNSAPFTETISLGYAKRDGRWQIKTIVIGH